MEEVSASGGHSSQPSQFIKTTIFLKDGDGERDGGGSGTHWEHPHSFPVREGVPLCFLGLRAGRGQGRGRE